MTSGRIPLVDRREALPAEHRAAWDQIVESRGHVAGPFAALLHAPEIAALATPTLAQSPEALRKAQSAFDQAQTDYLQGKYDSYVAWGQSDVMPDGDTLRQAWAELTAGDRFIIGSPQTAGRVLAEHAERAGTTHLICRMQWPGMEQELVLRSMRLLAEEALPASGLRLARP